MNMLRAILKAKRYTDHVEDVYGYNVAQWIMHTIIRAFETEFYNGSFKDADRLCSSLRYAYKHIDVRLAGAIWFKQRGQWCDLVALHTLHSTIISDELVNGVISNMVNELYNDQIQRH